MFVKSIKTFLAVGIVAAGAAVSTTGTANAGSSFGIYIGNGYGSGIHYNNRKHRNHGYNGGHGYRHYGHGYGHRRGCGPRRALNKAYRVGLNRPHIARINHRKIVVVGYNYGHPAKVVFKRKGHGCKIIKTRGLY
jgi:predicted NBD/HSP70 family sugar kinase